MNPHLISPEDLLKKLNTNLSTGLTESQVEENRSKYGANQLSKEPPVPLWKQIIEALKDPMLLILLVAAGITLAVNLVKYFTGEPTEFIELVGIVVAIALSVTITIVMEGRSQKAFEALNKINDNISIKVLRNGQLTQIPVDQIVVGDLVEVETGDKIPADGRLISSTSLNVDESALTGESSPAKKDAQRTLTGEVPLAERCNMVYSGCFVTSGRGLILITAVGDDTEFGKIAQELSSVDQSTTPLQEKLDQLGKKITMISVVATIIIFIVQVVRLFLNHTVTFAGVGDIFITSIVLIVAAVPEGLPTTMAISLALNVIKMAKQNALVKKMVACETIGSVNIICSDKTGTLTENKMTVGEILTMKGYCKPEKLTDEFLIANFAVNSSGNITKRKDQTYEFIGSPTECSLLVALDKSGYDYKSLRESANVVHSYPFSSDNKNMTTVIRDNGQLIAFTKGSPEKILSMVDETEEVKQQIQEEFTKFQRQAKRILAFAHKQTDVEEDYDTRRQEIESNMIFDGFVVISDPIRKEVYAAVDSCKNAGITIKMLTGDNIVTATSIASELGIISNENQVYHASNIEKMTDDQLERVIDNIRVIARSTPSTKMRIVNMLKKRGNVVAVTGDGINDAPALKNADVGIAMGITGTEVSKEASDIVLLDDSFSTIVNSVKWGRGIYENFQRFLQFQLTVNLSAVFTVFVSAISGMAAPFSAIQLLWVNIIMDGPPALTLGLEPVRDNIMEDQPTKRGAGIVTGAMFRSILINGLFISVVALWQRLGNFLGAAPGQESSVLFTLFVLFQLFNAFNARCLGTKSIFQSFGKNLTLVYVILATFLLQVLITQFGGRAFNTAPLDLFMWIKVVAAALSVVVVAELSKWIIKLFSKK